jgi:hypothetical protein
MKNHLFLLKLTKISDFFAFFTKIIKNQYFLKKSKKTSKMTKIRKT